MVIVIKNCVMCNVEIECHHHSKKYCNECKVLRKKELCKRNREISKNRALIDIDTTDEEFKQIEGFEDYEISNCGRVWSKRSNKFLKLNITNTGYCKIALCKNKKIRQYGVHRLVAFHFIYNPNEHKIIDHINRIRTDNHASNLRWTTHKINNNNNSHVINRKGNIYIQKTGNKRFCVRYYSKNLTDKKLYSKSFYTRDEAEDFQAKHLS